MSYLYVSGLTALLRKAYLRWTPTVIKSVVMTTTYNIDNIEKNSMDLTTGKESTPFVHGLGHADPNRALGPGLVYDIEDIDTVDCSAHKLAILGDLNYPSFSVMFESENGVVKYKRKVKNVGTNVDAVYELKVNAPLGVEVSVSPSKLGFSFGSETLSYETTFSSLGGGGGATSSFGSIE
ncbi:hypothetical protein LguiB_031506 [Lonicera macranthoides]